ncbi:MAG TPA: OB-fold nucleic acid binding domain-containing protein [Pseudonocardia sp.]|jgi:hypothetical protein
MGTTDGGLLRKFLRKLTSDVEDLDADDLTKDTEKSGAQRACDCRCGDEVTVVGRLRSVELSPKDSAATLEAELFDGTDDVILIWVGRREIAGIEPGRKIKVRGRMAIRNGRKVLYNPHYELRQAS